MKKDPAQVPTMTDLHFATLIKVRQLIWKELDIAQKHLENAIFTASADANEEYVQDMDRVFETIRQIKWGVDRQRYELCKKLEKNVGAAQMYQLLD